MHQLVNHPAFFEVYKMLALVSTFSSFLLAWKCRVCTSMSGSEPSSWISLCSLSSFTTFCLLNFPVICFVINILNKAALLLQKLNSLNLQLIHILLSSFFSPQSQIPWNLCLFSLFHCLTSQSPSIYSNLASLLGYFLRTEGGRCFFNQLSYQYSIPYLILQSLQQLPVLHCCHFTLSWLPSYCRTLFIFLSGSLPSWLGDDEVLYDFPSCLSTFSPHTFLSSLWFQSSSALVLPSLASLQRAHHKTKCFIDLSVQMSQKLLKRNRIKIEFRKLSTILILSHFTQIYWKIAPFTHDPACPFCLQHSCPFNQ